MNKPADILQTILEHKQREIAERKQSLPLTKLKTLLANAVPHRSFTGAIKTAIDNNNAAVIAEVKKASPSKGVIREQFDPLTIANSYLHAGATCLSVLTDEKFFQGRDHYLTQIREICPLPLLRKDFIIDPYQVYEAKLIGADCILLIVSALTEKQLLELTAVAKQLELDVLIEVHDANELQIALKTDALLIGINNRNLHTFKTDIQTTIDLSAQVPADRIIITESGIHTREDVSTIRNNNIHGFLVGEAFMRADDPGAALQALFN